MAADVTRQGVSAIDTPSNTIRFILDGERYELANVDPTRTVLQFLREDLGRKGTKEGCAEGDCGACTVVLLELNAEGDDVTLRPVNSCIQFLPTLDGKELLTVESLAREDGLHPVQQAMVDHHGSQCGFCTPGFVMSLFTLYKTNPKPTRREIDDALAGNLCRCTGYRPIVAAAEAMYDAETDTDWLRQPAAQDGRFKPPAVRVDALRDLQREASLQFAAAGRSFFAPLTADELAGLFANHPEATLLAGGTDIGLWVTKQHRELETVIYTGRVAELNESRVTASHIEIGAAVTLADAMEVIVANYPGLYELFWRFASPPIRNAGTLGGNIANGSPIGDSMPALMVLGSSLVLRRGRSRREVSLDDFYLDYQVKDLRAAEFVETVRIPVLSDDVIVGSHKLSKRFDQDISAVCNAYRLELDGETVTAFRMACGGMAATVRRAHNCEAAVTGKPWNEETIDAACKAFARDFEPISDMRASAGYRLRAAQNLLRRFYLESRGELEESVYAYGRS
ncbi:MAG: xanthine dehydrogenase small subunit [Woeseiaceae bacterium]|nr:xanthine dehydrogenase small subunit [Woeseiaceae bacterium]